MEKVKGLRLDKLDIFINKKGDILSIEGPFLSHFYDEEGKDYLMLWVDADNRYNRWILFRTEKIKLYEYLKGNYSLKKLLDISNYDLIYFLDIDNEGIYKKTILTIKDNIPKDYLPQSKSFFNEEYAEKYAINLKYELSTAILEDDNIKILTNNSFFKSSKKKYVINTKSVFNHASLNSFNEIVTLKFSHLPVFIHYENSKKDQGFRHLLSMHQSAYTNPVDLDLYFIELNKILQDQNNDTTKKDSKIDYVFEKLVISTIQIVQHNPTKYMQYYIDWRNEIISSNVLPENIYKHLNNFKP